MPNEAEAKIKITAKDLTEPGLKSAGKKLQGIGKKMSLFITGPLTVMGGLALRNASQFEKQTVAFETMIGDATKAHSLMKDIVAFSAKTPFQLPHLQDAAKRLMGFGIEGDKVVDILRNLGNVSQGDSERLNRLTLAFGKLRAKGKATLEELNMFLEAGVPVLDELANMYDVTTQEMFEMISEGKIGFNDVNQAIINLSTGSGQFAGMIEKQSKTLGGLFSTLRDNLGLLGMEIMQTVMPQIKSFSKKIIALVQRLRDMDDRTKKIILVIATAAATIGPLILVVGQLMIAIQAIIPVFAAVNAVMAANPIGLVIIAVAALAAGAFLLIKNWDKVKAFFINLWEKLKSLWDKIDEWVAIFVPFYGIPKLIIENWQPIIGFFQKIGDAIERFVNRFLELGDKIRGGTEKITGFFKTMFDKVVGKSYVPEMINMIIDSFEILDKYWKNDFAKSFEWVMESIWTSSMSFADKIKETIKSVIADILKAIAREYAALAAMFLVTLQFGKAAKYFAASAGLFSAAGAIMSLAKGGEFVTNGPQLLMVGDNPSGRERVRVEPSEKSGFGDEMIHVSINLNQRVLFDAITKGIRTKQIPVYRGALSGV